MLNYLFLPFLFWSIRIENESIHIRYGFKNLSIPISKTLEFKINTFLAVSFIKIGFESFSITLLILRKDTKIKVENELSTAFESYLSNRIKSIMNCYAHFGNLFNGNHYIRNYLSEAYWNKYKLSFGEEYLDHLKDFRNSFLFKKLDLDSSEKLTELIKWISEYHIMVSRFNSSFVNEEKIKATDYLKSIGQREPTDEQLEAIVTFENNNQLVASAGSGKSATLVNKVCYAIENKYANFDEVLVLAYGKDAALELIEKFKEVKKHNKEFKEPKAVSTFHSLGAKIISSTKKRLQIADWATDSDLFTKLLHGFVQDLQKEPEFMWRFATLCSLFRKQNAFGQKQQEYFSRVFSEIDDSWDLKQEVKREYSFLKTLNGENVKSMEELIISNWYYMHNIKYQYEKETDYKNYKGETRKHKPDFYLSDYGIYHEHFAINKDGTVPEYFHKGYLDTAIWKRKWYAEQKLPFFETSSAQFRDGSLFDFIQSKLKELNVDIKFKDNADLDKVFNEGALDSLLDLIAVSIKHIRNQGKTSNDFSLNPKYRDEVLVIFYEIVISVLKKYELHLKETQSLDFEGLLIEAANLVDGGCFKHNFKLILVDELQDISHSRLKLLLALVRQNPSLIVFTVGDDWQGIYKFSGADLDIFVNFEKYVGFTKEMYLTKTFRSNQGITTAAAEFVQKNKIQKKKSAVSSISDANNVIHVLDCNPQISIEAIIDKILSGLVDANNGKMIKVYILGRYNRSVPAGLNKLKAKFKQKVELDFKTFHKSKGLEAEYTIMVDMNCNGMAFPSLKEDHPLLRIFVDNNDTFPFAEERRLFYVALTRAKSKAFLLCEEGQRSVFVDELIIQNIRRNIIVTSKVT